MNLDMTDVLMIVVAALSLIALAIFTLAIRVFLTMVRRPNTFEAPLWTTPQIWAERLQAVENEKIWIYEFPHEDWYVTVEKDLILHATFLPYMKSKDTVICFHSFRGSAFPDYALLCKTIQRFGCNVLLVDLRAHGESDGFYTGLGYKDRRDVIAWCNYTKEKFPEGRVLLHGMDMGGTAVLLAAAESDLPENVKGVMADGVSPTLRYEVGRVFRCMKAPLERGCVWLASFLNKLFCGFFYGQCAPVKALAKIRVPVLLLGGEKDPFVVPEEFGAMQAAAPAGTQVYVAAGGRHLDGFESDPEGYAKAMTDFAKDAFGEDTRQSWPSPKDDVSPLGDAQA